MTARKDWFGTVTAGVAFDPDLTTNAKAVYLVLVMYRNRETDSCFPSNKTIAARLGVSERTVIRGMVELANAGVIERTPRFEDGRQISSLTTLTDAHDRRDDKTVIHGDDANVRQNTPRSNTDSTVETRLDYLGRMEETA